MHLDLLSLFGCTLETKTLCLAFDKKHFVVNQQCVTYLVLHVIRLSLKLDIGTFRKNIHTLFLVYTFHKNIRAGFSRLRKETTLELDK